MRSALRSTLLAAVLASVAMTPPQGIADPATDDYAGEVRSWRERRESRLKADGGWLTVAGLFWLQEGANRFGADPANEIVLPEGSAPVRAGRFEHQAGRTTAILEPGVTATVRGRPIQTPEMKSDSSGDPDVLALGALTMHVIQRGERYAIRLKDANCRFRKEFTGLRWYPIDETYRIRATWMPYDPPKEIPVPTVLGTTEKMPSPGAAVFTLGGQEVRLEPVLEEPDAKELFFIFRDGTSGKETYGAGRFLYADLPKDGKVTLDFNRAYNPPCAFTPYATCPLPPEQNRMTVRIEAGELDYGHH